MGTKRQEFWQQAAEEQLKRRDPVLAGFFALLAQPNEQERYEAQKADPHHAE